MNIQVTINMGQDDDISSLPGTSVEIAMKVLVAAGGDPEKDMCFVTIQDNGSVGGKMPEPPPVEEIPPPVEEIPPPVIDQEPVFATINSTFATNNSPPPGDKQIRTNATAFASVTAIYVDNQSTEGDDLSAQLLALFVGDTVELRGVTDTSRYAVFTVSAEIINQTDFVEIPVSISEAGNPLTNAACTLTYPDRL